MAELNRSRREIPRGRDITPEREFAAPVRAWITGAGGLIGSYLARAAGESNYGFVPIPLTRADLELTDYPAVRERFQRDRPHLMIHCAALSKSPICQADPALARKLNVEVTAHLTDLASEIPFIFFSTDLVFDGREGHYEEAAEPNPLSVYAETKVEAERLVLKNWRHSIIRTSLNGGTSPNGDRGFNEEMRIAWSAGKILTLFTDEFRCPIPAAVTARATWELVRAGHPGIFHIAGGERLSRLQIGELLAARWPELQPRFVPASIKSYSGAPRPADTSLNCSKAERVIGFKLPGLSEWLCRHPDEIF